MDDGAHLIELELSNAPVRLSCRFTLCHPPSADAVFLDLVHALMGRLNMKARVCEVVRDEEAQPFSLNQMSEFSALALRCIAARRAEWIAAFGGEQRRATTNEVHAWTIWPRCQQHIAPTRHEV